MPGQPVVDGKDLISGLSRLGYRAVRQRGSQVRLEHEEAGSAHRLTVPLHAPLAKGTLHDILNRAAEQTGLEREEVLDRVLGR